jgi:hypothetical protein
MSQTVQILSLLLMTFQVTVATELFLSVDALSRLLQTEQHFINSLDDYLTESRRRLEQLERYRLFESKLTVFLINCHGFLYIGMKCNCCRVRFVNRLERFGFGLIKN